MAFIEWSRERMCEVTGCCACDVIESSRSDACRSDAKECKRQKSQQNCEKHQKRSIQLLQDAKMRRGACQQSLQYSTVVNV